MDIPAPAPWPDPPREEREDERERRRPGTLRHQSDKGSQAREENYEVRETGDDERGCDAPPPDAIKPADQQVVRRQVRVGVVSRDVWVLGSETLGRELPDGGYMDKDIPRPLAVELLNREPEREEEGKDEIGKFGGNQPAARGRRPIGNEGARGHAVVHLT